MTILNCYTGWHTFCRNPGVAGHHYDSFTVCPKDKLNFGSPWDVTTQNPHNRLVSWNASILIRKNRMDCFESKQFYSYAIYMSPYYKCEQRLVNIMHQSSSTPSSVQYVTPIPSNSTRTEGHSHPSIQLSRIC
jgi:hypothetical protein